MSPDGSPSPGLPLPKPRHPRPLHRVRPHQPAVCSPAGPAPGEPRHLRISSQATPTVQCCTSRKGSPLPLSVILRVPHTSALTGKLPPDRKISMFLVRLASSLPSLSFLPSKDQTERQAFDWTALTASFWIPNNPLKTLFFNVGDAESSPPASAVTRIKGREKKWMYKLSSQTKAQLAHCCSF